MKPDTYAVYRDAVTRVLAQLTADLDASTDLAALAALANLSPYHFHRIFRGLVGETPLELLRRLRLERAAHQLRATALPVTQVAFAAGYETHEAFTRAFRAAFGEPPSSYRQHTRGLPVLAAANGIHAHLADPASAFVPRNPGGPPVEIRIETLPALRLATVAHRGPFNQIGQAFETLTAIAGGAGLLAHPDVLLIATYDEDPEGRPVDELQSRAGITVRDGVPLPPGLTEHRIPAGRYACHTHVGSYAGLGDAWARFMGDAMPTSGLLLAAGPALEIYRSDGRARPDAPPRTDLLVPVR